MVYRRFTRGFARPWPNTSASGDNDGIPGPTIRAEVGDTVIVHFENRDHHYGLPHSMHFHAFRYAPSSDGAFIPYRSGPGGNVRVGGAGPTASGPSATRTASGPTTTTRRA